MCPCGTWHSACVFQNIRTYTQYHCEFINIYYYFFYLVNYFSAKSHKSQCLWSQVLFNCTNCIPVGYILGTSTSSSTSLLFHAYLYLPTPDRPQQMLGIFSRRMVCNRCKCARIANRSHEQGTAGNFHIFPSIIPLQRSQFALVIPCQRNH